MSSIIASAIAFGLCKVMYFCTHSTKWSLNVPLISWWSRSGANSSWISARLKSFVKGCYLQGSISYYIEKNNSDRTTTSETIPNFSHKSRTTHPWINISVSSRVRGSSDSWPSRSFAFPWHLQAEVSMTLLKTRQKEPYFAHQSCTTPARRTCSG